MPGSTIIDLACSEQEPLLFELRRARFGYWLALHIILTAKQDIRLAAFCQFHAPGFMRIIAMPTDLLLRLAGRKGI